MKYRVRHETRYDYEDPVSISHHILRITPRTFGRQICEKSEISVFPIPPSRTFHFDYFGNPVTTFTLIEPHERITIDCISWLEVNAPPAVDFSSSPAWELIRDSMHLDHSPEGLAAYQFVFDSKRSESRPELADYARESFPPGCPLLEGMLDLTRRINRDFKFDSKATDISTPVETFFEKRAGVCQDFSHLQIACMRSLGLPARYVSGYLRTMPPPGGERLVGADASHAWCATWTAPTGWVDFDPTNNCVPRDGHVTVAWGRDYGDVSPVYGVLLGGSDHTLHVGVDVLPIA